MKIKDFIKPYRWTIVLIVVLTLGQVIGELLLPNLMAKIVDEGIAKGDTSFIIDSGVIMLIISLFAVICAISAGFFASRTALSVAKNLRQAVFEKVTGYSLSEFDRIGTSSLITRTTNDVQQIQQTTFMTLRMMMRAPVMCIGAAFLAVRKDSGLSLLLLAIIPIIGGLIYLILVKAMPLFRQVQKKLDQLNLVLRETLVGIRIIRAFSRIGFYKKKFKTANEDLTQTSIRVNRIMAILDPAIGIGMNALTIAIIYVASFRIEKGDLMVGDMMAFIQYAMQVFMSLTMITMMFVMLPRAFASAERIRDVFNQENEIKDPAQSQESKEGRRGLIEFKEVSFRYRHAENCAVKKASFIARPGETIAIIGGTGSGKTSLLNLILRYYDIEKGFILIDGVDIRKMKQQELHDMIGIVPQKTTLFSGTIKENIWLGKQNATDEEIKEACHIAQAEEFIEALPEKYNSEVAQGGTNFSGGQKQRLSIARAIVKRPKIYLFDDCFSALDFKTDAKVRKELNKITTDATVILVAQRVTSIQHADRILVMDNGSIVGQGKHEELLKENKVYQEIVESQLSEVQI
jgi:ABC-type multidrug transport system, ATPase and permease components